MKTPTIYEINNVTNVKLTQCELLTEKVADGCLPKHYLALAYEFEDDNGKYELIIPKINLNIPLTRIPSIKTGDFYSFDHPSINLFGINLRMDRAKSVIVKDLNGKKQEVKDVNFIIRTIEEKVHELTIEEIQEKLGYKIKIVAEKEKCDD